MSVFKMVNTENTDLRGNRTPASRKVKVFGVWLLQIVVTIASLLLLFVQLGCSSHTEQQPSCVYTNERDVDVASIPDSQLPIALCDEARFRAFEQDVAAHGVMEIDVRAYLDVIFQYRDTSLRALYFAVIESPDVPVYFTLQSILVLGEIGNGHTLQYLLEKCAQEENVMVREYYAGAIGKLADSTAIPGIERCLRTEKNGYVVKTFKAALRRIISARRARFSYLPLYDTTRYRMLRVFPSPNAVPDFSLTSRKKIEAVQAHDMQPADRCVYPHLQYKKCPAAYDKVRQPFNSFALPGVSHVGEDSGWLFAGLPVHTIMNGTVVLIQHEESWGCLVCIESRLTNGQTVCHYYGHLSHDIDVYVGRHVECGDKIGEIGPAFSFQNGGYRSHLHLGIEKAPIGTAVVAGYNDDVDHWFSPVEFIRDRL